jgi:hypothetical protein
MGALYLSSKLEECPVRMRDLINVYDLLLRRAAHAVASASASPQHHPSEFKYTPMSYFGNTFYDLKEALVVSEMQILKRLAFDVQVVLPYGTLVNYMRLLGLTSRNEAVSMAWGYLNDACVLIAEFSFGVLADLEQTEQITNTRVCTVPCADSSERSHSAHDAPARYIVTIKSRELLVGIVRRGLGRFMECMRAHHAVIQATDDG